MKSRPDPEPETRVGHCCGCRADPVTLYKIAGIYRYRCDSCYQQETGLRHYLAPPQQPAESLIILP